MSFQESRVFKAYCKEKLVVEPYKYYALAGESIFKIGECGFIHLDSFGRIIYKNVDLPMTVRYEVCDKFEQFFKEICNYRIKDLDYEHQKRLIADSDRPIIIGGCGRSGTTLLASILDSHHKLSTVKNETYAFYPKPYRLRVLIDRMPNGRWVEKTPKNVLVFDEIWNFFNKNVKIIHMVRDARSVITSEHPNWEGKYWVDLNRWVSDVSKGLEFNNGIIVKYEDLVAKPRKTLKGICEFIEEDFDSKMLDYQKFTTFSDDPSFGGNIRKIDQNSLQKWKNPRHSSAINKFYENKSAIDLMKRLDYF